MHCTQSNHVCDPPIHSVCLQLHMGTFSLSHYDLLALQAFAKEEEICELQVKLRERDSLLFDYKKENARFAEIQQQYKSDIGTLQQQVSSVL